MKEDQKRLQLLKQQFKYDEKLLQEHFMEIINRVIP